MSQGGTGGSRVGGRGDHSVIGLCPTVAAGIVARLYAFGGLAYAGLLIAWGSTAPLIVFLVGYPAYQFCRARKEAQVLEKAFGDEYRRYKASTWL